LATFQLHLITEPKRSFGELQGAVGAAVAAGVDWVQLRDKSASALTMYRQAGELRSSRIRLSINDRLDVALACGAQGVHLAAQSLPVREAKALAGGRLIVGRSVHGLDEAVACAGEGADYLTFGHVFPSASKPGLEPRGIAQLAEIVRAVEVPVMAIGGIDVSNVNQVLATGCAGIAIISAILSASDPRRAAAELRRALDGSTHRPRHSFELLEDSHASHPEPTAV
jgi:thiamine-phosphate pyrophosphorylase